MAQLDKTFPTLDCAACILTPKMVDAAQNEKIRIFTYSEVTEVHGFVGNFDVTIKKKLATSTRTFAPAAAHVPKMSHAEGAERVQSRHGQSQRNLYPVCAGNSEGCNY